MSRMEKSIKELVKELRETKEEVKNLKNMVRVKDISCAESQAEKFAKICGIPWQDHADCLRALTKHYSDCKRWVKLMVPIEENAKTRLKFSAMIVMQIFDRSLVGCLNKVSQHKDMYYDLDDNRHIKVRSISCSTSNRTKNFP